MTEFVHPHALGSRTGPPRIRRGALTGGTRRRTAERGAAHSGSPIHLEAVVRVEPDDLRLGRRGCRLIHLSMALGDPRIAGVVVHRDVVRMAGAHADVV